MDKFKDTAPPGLRKFFDRLAALKEYTLQKYEETQDENIKDIYDRLDSLLKIDENLK